MSDNPLEDWKARVDEAADPTTTADRLRELARANDAPTYTVELANNPSSPADLLADLADELGYFVALNPSASAETLAHIVEQDPGLRSTVAGNANISDDLMRDLATDSDPRVRLQLTGNPHLRMPTDTTIWVLRQLSNDQSPLTRSNAETLLSYHRQRSQNDHETGDDNQQ